MAIASLGSFFQVLDYSHLLVPPLAEIVQYLKKLIRLHITWNTFYRLSIRLKEKGCGGCGYVETIGKFSLRGLFPLYIKLFIPLYIHAYRLE